ncbi:sacsin-like [Anneissia japonica]|uniref:sacsin-like n=1 Tax=Anneissia japonica TaxID=1529436 RepID=UPI001425A323|nr:sacsin-like [Anneissia japonica]
MFGQVQKLTSRIREILKGYPCDDTIFKELLQNSDDAGADKINFIYDPRQHPNEKVFCESWKQTLGPALCVFNNKPFTESDLKGIQDLGIGSKSFSPDKTGQYGIGFNSVYHLTDCPTFLSNDDTLCIFDPRCAFIDQATRESPGFQYNISPQVNNAFRDALSCFRLESITNAGCTMFRFPLRTTEMNTYANLIDRESIMSEELFDGKKLQTLLQYFELDAFDMLLYLNNLKQITISHMDENNKMCTDYSVKAELSEEDDKKRHEFYSYVKECGNKARLEDIRMKEVTYEMKISDSRDKTEIWLVNQRIGSTQEIPIKISSSYTEGNLKLLPRGGVAARLHSSEKRKSFFAYCFLPLPIEPKLPVSVNGHFSLDPSRRNLSNTSQNNDWNLFIMGEVISHSYLRLLEKLRDKKFRSVNDSKYQKLCTFKSLHNKMNSYWRYFPNIHSVHNDWKEIAKCVFLNICSNQMPLFPVVRRTDNIIACELDETTETNYTLEWCSATGPAEKKAYFDTRNTILKKPSQLANLGSWDRHKETKKMLLKPILQNIGFRITNLPYHIYEGLASTGSQLTSKKDLQPDEVIKSQLHKIELVSPDAVVQFMRNEFIPGPLPCKITMSRLKINLNYLVLLEYIANDGKLRQNEIPLDGLPLLLTQDSYLRTFDKTDNKCFLSGEHELLPECWNEFVHENTLHHFSEESLHFKHLKISDLAERLEHNLQPKYNADQKVPWDPDSDVIPNKAWIKNLWEFLKREFSDLQCDDPFSCIKSLMGNWAVFPVKVKSGKQKINHYLMPFSSADSVIHSNISDIGIRDAFAKMELPEIDDSIFHKPKHFFTYRSESDTTMFVTQFIATVSSPERILTSIVALLNDNDKAFDVLTSENKKNILLFFERVIGTSLNKHIDNLKKLPCYLSIYEEHISLDQNKKYFVLHSSIPEIEKEQWVTNSKAQFIKEDLLLKKLQTHLGLTTCNEADVYKQFILPSFDKFSHNARVEHLRRIRTLLPYYEEKKRTKMISYMGLKETPLLSHRGQSIKCICEYFEASIKLFKIMLGPEKFLPNPFCDSDWNDFMKELGLVTEPTPEKVLEFAQKIEQMFWYDIKKQKEKSKAVIDHIARSEELKSNTDFLRKLRCIKFLVPHTVNKHLATLHEQYKEHSVGRQGIAYNGALTCINEHLVWTSATILPDYAFPYFYPSKKRLAFSQILPTLNASKTPSVDIVLRHIKNLCTNLKAEYSQSKRSVSRAKSVECKDTLHRVMNDIYEILCKKLENPVFSEQIVREINDKSIMLVDEDECLIKCEFTVKKIKAGLVLKPYIYQVPECFAQYMELFSRLGAQEKPSVWQCCQLLTMIHKDIRHDSFGTNPNLKLMIKFAVRKIFKSYLIKDWLKDITILYLPNRSCQLITSSSLNYYDKPMFEVRMKEKNDRNVLIDLKKEVELEKDATEYIQKMPKHLQPCAFSQKVEEIMSTKPEENMCRYAKEGLCEQLNIIRRKIQSKKFQYGFHRLMKHEANMKGINLPEHIRANVPALSKDLSIQCLKELKTCLVESNVIKEGSTVQKQCFLVDADRAHKTIFIRHQDSGKYNLLMLELAVIISELNGELISDVMTLAMMIFCDLNEIQTLLSYRNISDAHTPECMSSPDLGSELTDDLVESLDNDPFNEFTPGEIVVYELGKAGDEVYIYAKILRQIIRTDSELNTISMMYEIDIGRYANIEVSALHLYKWVLGHSRTDINHHEEMALQAMVNMSIRSDSERAAPTHRQRASTPLLTENLEETKNIVSDKLEVIWRLGEYDRKKAVKRMYLQWHPDKNPGREEFCSEGFMHLRNEIHRLENRLPRQRTNAATRANYNFTESGRWHESYTQWDQRADRDRKSREFYGSSNGHTSPSPDKAKIWQKQAREDLYAADNDINGYPSYEWVAYKCLQAVEKSMKAAILSHTGENSFTHDIISLSITVSDLPGCPNDLRKHVNELCAHGKDQIIARYPRLLKVPHDLFKSNDANICISNAKAILEMMDIVIVS